MSVSGVQYKTLVEYAPSQRAPKQSSRKDGREGTIFKGNILIRASSKKNPDA